MGCSSSLFNRNEVSAFKSNSNFTVVSFPEETKNILTESWKLVEPVKTAAGKKMFQRLFETHPEVLNMFPTFKGLTQQEIMSSRSLYLHVKIVMRALENAVLSLNDWEKFTQYLMNLGERHRPWSLKMEHFDLLKEAFLWTLQDMLQATCTAEVRKAWSEMVDFMATTMMYGLKSRNHVISSR
ncbi:neuroglobin-like [Oculina patagonica]